ncbi:uncharacterized protein LOC119676034 [Teleopsis dalmanni]|uniref:uncharacterized protein LOC119676034 n=1 Tax=Teleopsis dalmanni TaxID=139649 RepID=UPI0018CEEF7C|nr:uncharacterized protein LOC119676034 [Teleopsis dalmanni]
MGKRDYKVATTDGIELEPLGGEKSDKERDKQINGVTFGLAASCDTLLLAEMSVSRFHPIIINNGQVHNSTLTSNSDEQNITTKQNLTENYGTKKFNYTKSSATTSSPSAFASTTATSSTSTSSSATGTATASATNASASASAKLKRTPPSQSHAKTKSSNKNNDNSTTNNEIIYKFYVPRNIGVATARITIAQVCLQCPDVGFHIQANALPSYTSSTRKNYESNYIHSTIIKPNQTGEISIEFYVQPNTWHYALLKFENAVGDASSSLTETDAKLFDRLATSTSDLRLRNMPTAFTYGQRQRIQQLQQQQRAHRRQNATDGVSEANETIWYHLVYSLRIDFQEPVNEDENADSDANISNNKENGAENMSTSIKTSPKMAATSETDTNNGTKESGNNTTANSKSNAWKPVIFRDMEFYPLLRQTYREFFMFDYDLVPDSNGTVPTVLNLTAGIPAGFAFEIGEVYDIGGTLSFAVSMKHGLKGSNELKSLPTMTSPTERSGILAEKLIGRPFGQDDDVVEKEENKALPRSNQTIIVCMHHGEPGEPTWPDKCRYGRKLYPASSIVNNTDSNTSTGLVHVPFPESGQWYVTMGLYCHGAETAARVTIIDSVKDFVKKYGNMLDEMRAPCACANSANYYLTCINDRKCLASMNETETLKIKECLMDSKCTSNYVEMTRKFEVHHKFATEQHFALDNCNSSVVFTISSSPCVAGRCGRFGRCYHYMSGGFVFSTCVCMKGYRGWDCTEDSQVPSSMSILLASLLLTLSNLLFFPSIYMAVRRKYYTEAVIYFFAMFFSIFYHACDSGEDEYSFCLVKIGVLQFCDFYCGLLAIWVTLVAMSHVRPQFVSLLHMFGAILLAFGTELNKQSLWVFLAPALTGICIISVSWGLRCHKSRKWFPARKYLTVYMPIGTVLVMVGLVCYAFLQTKQNYHIVHSIWHMVMALSILCLLPSRKSFIPKC